MTTKEQERQAIAKIRKIVEGLGENSYVGTAMQGVLEIAEQNIEYDAAFSLKGEVEVAEKREKEQRTIAENLQSELKKLKEEREQEKAWFKDQQTELKKKLQEQRTLAEKYQMPEDMYQNIWMLIDEAQMQAQTQMMQAAEAMAECVGEDTVSKNINQSALEFKKCRAKVKECESVLRELDKRYEK